MPTIRNRVKELRSERGWTQQQLAEAVGVSRQSINSIERERYVPSLELALTFARVFGMGMLPQPTSTFGDALYDGVRGALMGVGATLVLWATYLNGRRRREPQR